MIFKHCDLVAILSCLKRPVKKGETVDDLLIFVSSQKMEREEAKRKKKVLIIGCRKTFLGVTTVESRIYILRNLMILQW